LRRSRDSPGTYPADQPRCRHRQSGAA
jgi:hypothetical protein